MVTTITPGDVVAPLNGHAARFVIELTTWTMFVYLRPQDASHSFTKIRWSVRGWSPSITKPTSCKGKKKKGTEIPDFVTWRGTVHIKPKFLLGCPESEF